MSAESREIYGRDVTVHGIKVKGADELVRMVPFEEYEALWQDLVRMLKNNAVLRTRIADLSRVPECRA